jgi:predicted Rossmann fold flavoprotein
MNKLNIIIIGGGAAGFFAAIRAAECNPDAQVIILEKSKDILGKVKVSGGGRCNLTHACFVPRELSKFYPRGEKELLGPFNRFASGDTIEWFEKRGVKTKIEADGRMFPVSDDSQTIVDCLWAAARKSGVNIFTNTALKVLHAPSASNPNWIIETAQQKLFAQQVMIASGSSPSMWAILAQLGHTIIEPVPSLFTFNIKDSRLTDLLGISVPLAEVKVEGSKLSSTGPLLITHWGMSGPAILKLSAWGARELATLQYKFAIRINWIMAKLEDTRQDLEDLKQEDGRKMVSANTQFGLPIRLWKRLVAAAGIRDDKRWADLSKKEIQTLAEELTQGRFQVNGKSTFKEEFVTAGGVDLKEVDFKTFGSKLFPGLFFAGEVLNIDAITGGFNFQAAWTGGWIAGEAMAKGTQL